MDQVTEASLAELAARLERLEREHNRSLVRAIPDSGRELLRVRTYDDLPADAPLGTYGYVTGDEDSRGWFAEAGTLPPHDVGYYRIEQVRDVWDAGDPDDESLDTLKNEWMPLNTPLYARVISMQTDILVCAWVKSDTYVPFLPPTYLQFAVSKPYHLRRRFFDRDERPQIPLLGLDARVKYHQPSSPDEDNEYEFEVAQRERSAFLVTQPGAANEIQQISPDYALDEVISIVRFRHRIPTFEWPPFEGTPIPTFARWEDVNTAGRCWAAVPGSQQ